MRSPSSEVTASVSASLSTALAASSAIKPRLAVERTIVLQQCTAIVVAHHLQRNTEFATIRQDALVVVRQPRRAGIEIEMVAGIPTDMLHAVGLAYLVT